MTANWFEAKVKYVKVGEDGKEKKMSELYYREFERNDPRGFLYRGIEEIEYHGVGGVE